MNQQTLRHRVDILGERYRLRVENLSPGLQTVAHYLNDHRDQILESTAMEIANVTQTSDATVIRTIQALGFAGLRDLKQALAQWFGPVISSSDKMATTVNALSDDVNSGIDFVLEGHRHTCNILSSAPHREAIAQAVALLINARQVAIFGIGASGILAEYSARQFCRIGLSAATLNHTGIALAEQLIQLQRGDVLLMMAQKSPHREGLTTLKEAQRLDIPVILLTNAPDSEFARQASVIIQVPRGAEKGRIPLHGTVLLCLEMIVLAVASATAPRTIKTVKRINEFHRGLKQGTKRSSRSHE
ncbi:MAG: putative HTH-type transcriptional regulator YbbH [Candidatus Erwinia impunctatus]|nr:putative HTH-type transcriptional regulator YbbH [Culicoides impunctatus]